MKKNWLVLGFLWVGLQAITVMGWVAWQPAEAGRGGIINYALLKSGLLFLLGTGIAGLLFLAWLTMNKAGLAARWVSWLDGRLRPPAGRLWAVQVGLVLAGVFLAECFLLTYMGFPVPLRPVFAWGALLALQGWLLLRGLYRAEYAARLSLFHWLREKWRGWLPTQRKTALVLLVFGLIHFLIFVPANLVKDDEGRLILHEDEYVIYPDVVKMLQPQPTLQATVYNVLKDWPWWYGYPYVPVNLVVLLIPRLVYGPEYVEQVNLNIFLLRQFVSVLPMIIGIWGMIYLVNRFKKPWESALLYIFIAWLPGVVRFNFQFWHPDALVLLLVLGVLYFLERDRLRFGLEFALAAVCAGLVAALKLWGFFFFLAVAGYLAAGAVDWARKRFYAWLAFRRGLTFVFYMVMAILISTPQVMIPYMARSLYLDWSEQGESIFTGYDEPDPTGVYETTLSSYLDVLDYYYMTAPVFFFGVGAVVLGSLWGSRKFFYRLLLGWLIPTLIFVTQFTAMKSFQYSMPIILPLYLAIFMLPSITAKDPGGKTPAWLQTRQAQWTVVGLVVAVLFIQWVINIDIVLTSPLIGLGN